jgi:hypothetical protein
VTVVDPDNALNALDEIGEGTLMDDFDLVVVRGRSLNVLCLVTMAETAGVWTVNRLLAIRGVLNKAQMGFKLIANRIPKTPGTRPQDLSHWRPDFWGQADLASANVPGKTRRAVCP